MHARSCPPYKTATILLTLALAAGCAGEGTTTSSPSSSGLNQIQSTILTAKCATSGCHDGVIQSPDLSSAAASYTALVGVSSTLCSDQTFVVAGDAEASYLIEKLGASPTCGALMPITGSSLSTTEIALIAAWINAGASEPSASLLAKSDTDPAAQSTSSTSTTSSTSSTSTTSTTLYY